MMDSIIFECVLKPSLYNIFSVVIKFIIILWKKSLLNMVQSKEKYNIYNICPTLNINLNNTRLVHSDSS